MDWMPQAIRDGIIVVLVISGPVVMVAALIGLIIGVLQAATQVQEQTIGSALKIIGVFLLIIIVGFWMYQYLSNYTSRTFSFAFTNIPNQLEKVIPANKKEEEPTTREKVKTPQELKVLPPKEIEIEGEQTTIPHGLPILGAPKIPQHPPVIQAQPKVISQPPEQILKPNLPGLHTQEPIALPTQSPTPHNQIPSWIN